MAKKDLRLTCKQAAYLIGKSEPNLLYMRKEKQGPEFEYDGGKYHYLLSDIITWSLSTIEGERTRHGHLLARAEQIRKEMEG